MAATLKEENKPMIDPRQINVEISNSKALLSELGSLLKRTLTGEKQLNEGSLLVERTMLSLSKIECSLPQISAVHLTREFPDDGFARCITGIKKEAQPSKKRRTKINSNVKISTTFADGHTWRKYGQKPIQGSKFHRSYYRCTYKYSRRCSATKQVQLKDDDSSLYVVTYFGEHTCCLELPAPNRSQSQLAKSPIDPDVDSHSQLGSYPMTMTPTTQGSVNGSDLGDVTSTWLHGSSSTMWPGDMKTSCDMMVYNDIVKQDEDELSYFDFNLID